MNTGVTKLDSLQENVGSQLKDAENQLQDANKIGEQLGSQLKGAENQLQNASKIGEQLGSLLKKGGKRKKITRKFSSRAFRKTRRRRQIYR